jgi:hypothetical protein
MHDSTVSLQEESNNTVSTPTLLYLECLTWYMQDIYITLPARLITVSYSMPSRADFPVHLWRSPLLRLSRLGKSDTRYRKLTESISRAPRAKGHILYADGSRRPARVELVIALGRRTRLV